MTTVRIGIPLPPPTPLHRRAYLLAENGTRVEFHRTPPESTADGDAATFVQIERPGLLPLSRRGGPTLRQIGISPQVGNDNAQQSCEAQLASLRSLAASGARVQLVWGQLERGWWNISAMPITVVSRVEGTNDVSRCTVELTLTQANDITLSPGSTSTKGNAKAPARDSGTGYLADAWVIVKVKSGDTLYKLATKWLGKGTRWPEIAKANKIKNPKSGHKLQVGQTLKIPPE